MLHTGAVLEEARMSPAVVKGVVHHASLCTFALLSSTGLLRPVVVAKPLHCQAASVSVSVFSINTATSRNGLLLSYHFAVLEDVHSAHQLQHRGCITVGSLC